ncbi:PIN domain nuclease [Peterkaempfera bronchialis]|uniref:PIN domain nuclease n=1 Tax=Peterkaempfera bronchialis TaxID=2126346 RepID=UPI003C2C2B55
MPAAERFLIDKSAYERVLRPNARGIWTDVLVQGRVSLCAPTEAEILYSVRSVAEYRETKHALRELYGWVPVPEDAWSRLLELQERMAAAGCHRSASIADLLVAITAQHHRLTVLHYDRDFETVAKVTGQPVRWLAPPGTLD